MKTKDIEPGGLYLMPSGSIREVVSIHSHQIRYRYVKIGNPRGLKVIPKLGTVLTMSRSRFAEFCVREVTAWQEVV